MPQFHNCGACRAALNIFNVVVRVVSVFFSSKTSRHTCLTCGLAKWCTPIFYVGKITERTQKAFLSRGYLQCFKPSPRRDWAHRAVCIHVKHATHKHTKVFFKNDGFVTKTIMSAIQCTNSVKNERFSCARVSDRLEPGRWFTCCFCHTRLDDDCAPH